MSSLLAWLLAQYGEHSINLAGRFTYWLDIGIWSALEDQSQRFLGL